MPAAVPFTAQTIGLSQSCSAAMSRSAPRHVRSTDSTGRAGAPAGTGCDVGSIDAQVGAGAERPVTRRGEQHRPHRDVGVVVVEQRDDPVTLRRRECVARLRPVQLDGRDRAVDDVAHLLLEGTVVGHCGLLVSGVHAYGGRSSAHGGCALCGPAARPLSGSTAPTGGPERSPRPHGTKPC